MIRRSKVAHLKSQRGLSLIESLVALLVLTLGVMGLAGVQGRMLAETRTSNARAIAVGLIDDIANRMAVNRDQAMAAGYNFGWANAWPAGIDCTVAPCSNAQRRSLTATYGSGQWWRCWGPMLGLPSFLRLPHRVKSASWSLGLQMKGAHKLTRAHRQSTRHTRSRFR